MMASAAAPAMVRFRECQRAKQTTFLPFQGKDRNKGQG